MSKKKSIEWAKKDINSFKVFTAAMNYFCLNCKVFGFFFKTKPFLFYKTFIFVFLSECVLDTLETKDTSEGRKTENSDISVGRSAIVKQGQKKNNSNSRHGESEGSEENPEKIDIHLLLR